MEMGYHSKRSSQVWICGDFKQTVNRVLHIDKYPILNIDDLYSKVGRRHYFMRLDLSDAYLQVLWMKSHRD